MSTPVERNGTTFYFENYDKAAVKRFRDRIEQIEIDASPLKSVSVRDAHVLPAIGRASGSFDGGVFDHRKTAVHEAGIRRHSINNVFGDGKYIDPEGGFKELDRALYGGLLFGGYGHIILESTSRLWAAAAFEHVPILMLAPNLKSIRLFEAIARLLGVNPGRFVYVRKPIRVGELVVPEAGLDLGLRTNTNFVDFIRSAVMKTAPILLQDTNGSSKGVCYLSRAGLSSIHRRGFGEKNLEKWMLDRDVVVARAERLPLLAQVSLINEFDRFGGLIGSQLHNFIFRYANRPLHVAYLAPENPNANFFQIDLLFPGDRLYNQSTEYKPFFDFGNKSPFQISESAAQNSLAWLIAKDKAHAILEATSGQSEDFFRSWLVNFFDSKVFRRWRATDEGGPERDPAWFEEAWNHVMARFDRTVTNRDIDEFARIFEERALAEGMNGQECVQQALRYILSKRLQ